MGFQKGNKLGSLTKGKKRPKAVEYWNNHPERKMRLSERWMQEGNPNWERDMSEEKNPRWYGNDVGYSGIHTWVEKWKGQPSKCEMCGTETAKKFEWANIDHQYRRVLEDFIRMCTSCHRKYDYENNL